MGVRILVDSDYYSGGAAVLFCSTSDWAFGPVIMESESGDFDARQMAELFLKWLGEDPRHLDDNRLRNAYTRFRNHEITDCRGCHEAVVVPNYDPGHCTKPGNRADFCDRDEAIRETGFDPAFCSAKCQRDFEEDAADEVSIAGTVKP